MSQILRLDQNGTPSEFISTRDAISYHATDSVAWQLGDALHTLYRGGHNCDGEQSKIWTAPIIATKGHAKKREARVPPVNNTRLFARDNYTCAYCGLTFKFHDLSADHIIPVSKGGQNVWMNVVTACKYDNNRKDNKTLEEAGMELLYLPYTPNRFEKLILETRQMLPIQADYLKQFLPANSKTLRVLESITKH